MLGWEVGRVVLMGDCRLQGKQRSPEGAMAARRTRQWWFWMMMMTIRMTLMVMVMMIRVSLMVIEC